MAVQPSAGAGSRLITLEFGRGIAALLVVLYHYEFYTTEYLGSPPSWGTLFEGGHAGVEYFFVLSGFIIYYVHRSDIGNVGRLSNFYIKRFIRIVPMYWIVISLSCLSFALFPTWGSKKELDAYGIFCDYLLIPRDGQLILEPAWTLKREVLFYAIFSAIILTPKLGIAAFVFWQVSVLIANFLFFIWNWHLSGLFVYFLDIHNIGFGVGVFCAWLVTNNLRLSINAGAVALLIGCLGVLGVMGFEWLANDNFAGRQTVSEEIVLSGLYTASFAFIILGSVCLELSLGLKISRHLVLFGASSYMLYLIHDPLESLLMKLISTQHVKPYFNDNTAFLFAVVVAVAMAIYLHIKLEMPVTKLLGQKWLQKGKAVQRSNAQVIFRRRI